MQVKFCPLASGSSGNSVLISTEETNILIDAGLTAKGLENNLKQIDCSIEKIDAIFITHEHIDHVRGIGVLSRKYKIPIYATEKTWKQIDKMSALGEISDRLKQFVYIMENCIINDIIVNPFPIPHDCAAPVGYCIFAADKKICVVTDLGHVTDCIKESLSDSDIILIESNHDIDMLMNGRYPYHLKERVMGKNGHLSNVSCGNLLKEVVSKRLKHVFLGHLSSDNNKPEIAFNTVSDILSSNEIHINKDISLYLAERFTPSKVIYV